MSLRVVWTARKEPILYEDPLKHFMVDGFRATAQAEAGVEIPSIKFAWKSDPLTTSSAAFAIIGSESNGKYYDKLG